MAISRFQLKLRRLILDSMPDMMFLKFRFHQKMGVKLNLQNPRTFNEKLQWLKLYDRNPLYTTLVDKCAVKGYIAEKLGSQYVIPTLNEWENVDDIDFSKLPERFVLKCNHDSGQLIICTDKSKLDIPSVKRHLAQALNNDFYKMGREWPYKDVPRKVFAEQFMSDNGENGDFTDYKFYCFNGNVDCVMVCSDRRSGDTKFYFFDKAWNLKRINKRGKEAPEDFTLPKPECMDEMFRVASELSKGIPFARVDLYQSNLQVYFGEITFYPSSGFDKNYLPETDLYFGGLIDLSLAYSKRR